MYSIPEPLLCIVWFSINSQDSTFCNILRHFISLHTIFCCINRPYMMHLYLRWLTFTYFSFCLPWIRCCYRHRCMHVSHELVSSGHVSRKKITESHYTFVSCLLMDYRAVFQKWWNSLCSEIVSRVLYLNLNTFTANVHIPVCSSSSDGTFGKLLKHDDLDCTDGLHITVGLEDFFFWCCFPVAIK